tara:strand:- start:13 stop:327 length:315 start_codon:yes stop_codon:yes gene_type:complete
MVDFIVRDAFVYFFQCDLSFHPGKSSSQTKMRSIAESKVSVWTTVYIKSPCGRAKFSFVMVSRSYKKKNRVPFLKGQSVSFSITGHSPVHILRGIMEAEDFFYG